MTIKLTHHQHHAVTIRLKEVTDGLTEKKRPLQLLRATLKEISLKMRKQQLDPKASYGLKLSEAQMVALQWFCQDYMANCGNTYDEVTAGLIMNTTHRLLS